GCSGSNGEAACCCEGWKVGMPSGSASRVPRGRPDSDGHVRVGSGYPGAMTRWVWLLALLACSGGGTTNPAPTADASLPVDAAPVVADAPVPDGPRPDAPLPDGAPPDARPPPDSPPVDARSFDAAPIDAMPGPHFDVVYVSEW